MSPSTWNPEQYARFRDDRSRPYDERCPNPASQSDTVRQRRAHQPHHRHTGRGGDQHAVAPAL